MFVAALFSVLGVAQAADVTVGPHMEFWPSAARQQVGPGVGAEFHTDIAWWGIDAELAYANGRERSATVDFTHHFVRAAVLWSVRTGKERIQFQGGIGPAITLNVSQLSDENTSYSTTSALPGLRFRVGLGGQVNRFSWQWYTGATSVDFPRHHYDTGVRFGVNW